MSMSESVIRFDSAEIKWINGFAVRNGRSMSDVVREWTMQRLEDELDANDLIDVMIDEDGTIHPLPIW